MAPQSTANFLEISDKFIRHIANGEEAATIEILHPRTRKELPWEVISDVWTSILTDVGELQAITDQTVAPIKGSRNENSPEALSTKSTGTSVVISTLKHEAGELMSRIAINREGAIVGVLFLPLDATEYPF